jgi:hypothetical protein
MFSGNICYFLALSISPEIIIVERTKATVMVSLSEIITGACEGFLEVFGSDVRETECCFLYAARVRSLIRDVDIRFEVVTTVRTHIVAFWSSRACSVAW